MDTQDNQDSIFFDLIVVVRYGPSVVTSGHQRSVI